MEVPKGYELEGKRPKKILCPATARQHLWAKTSRPGLVRIFSKESNQRDDSILTVLNKDEVYSVVEAIKAAKLKITMGRKDIDFYGVTINQTDDGTIKFSQTR